MTEYWDKEIETMPQEKIKELQLKLFNQQLERANKAPAYQNKLPKNINNLDDIKNLPFTCKDDLRRNFPYGFLAVPKEEIARFNASSGTTGIPTLSIFNNSDLNQITNRVSRFFFMAGLRNNMSIQCTVGYGLFVAGWLGYFAARTIGSAIIPIGPGNTDRQLLFLKTLRPNCIFATPGYLQSILSKIPQNELSFNIAIVGGECCPEEAKSIILNRYGVDIFENYGSTEIGGSLAGDCAHHTGLHIAEDQFFCEIINPDTGELVPDGEYGELVVTPLQQEAMPLIRYRTRDITRFLSGDCPCGRTHRRIEPISHRIDDMMIINGVNVFPSQIEECIYKNLNVTTNYLIHIKEKGGLKKLKIDIELPTDYLNNSEKMKELNNHLMADLKSYITVSPILNFIPMGTLPEIQGKAKRVVKDVE